MIAGAAAPAPPRRRLHRPAVSPALLKAIVVVALAAALFGAYLAAWVSGREAAFTARNFRSLAGLGKQIESIIEVEADGMSYGGRGQRAVEKRYQEVALRVAYPEAPALPSQTYRIRVGAAAAPPPGPEPAAGPEEVQKPVLAFDAYPGGAAYLKVAVPGGPPRQLDLRSRIDPILSRDIFDHILVADANGNVLFEQEDREIRLTSLGAVLGAAPAGAAGEGKGLPRGREATARVRGVEISGGRYDLFVSPQRVPVARERPGEGTAPWLLCGLVRSDRLRDETLALPKTPLLTFVLVLAAVLLGLPLLKLRSLAPWEPLSRWDLGWLGASMFLIPTVLTIALWGGWHVFNLQRMYDETLQRLAGRIETNLAHEVRAYEQALETVDRAVSARVAGLLAGQGSAGEQALERSSLLGQVSAALGPLPFSNVYWIRSNGCQAYKINYGNAAALFNLHDREYFRSLASDVPPGGRAGARAVTAESIHSWTSGQPEVVVAVGRPLAPDLPVLAIGTPLDSLLEAVFPPGFGYAVVQNTTEVQGSRDNPRPLAVGEVLLYSDKRRNLRENVLQETEGSDAAWLQAMLASRASGWATVVYQGRTQRIYTRPLAVAGRPWSLIVFADGDRQADFFLHPAPVALTLAALFGLATAVVFGVYRLALGPRGGDWLWPQPRKLGTYPALIGFLLALVLLQIYVQATAGVAGVLLVAALAPLALLLAIHTGLGGPEPLPTWKLRAAILTVVAAEAALAVASAERSPAAAWVWLLGACVIGVAAAAAPAPRAPPAPFTPGSKEAGGWDGAPDSPAVRDRARRRHLLCLALGALPLAVFPTVALLDVAFASQLEQQVQGQQADLARRFAERRDRFAKELGEEFPAVLAPPPAVQRSCAGINEAYLPVAGGGLDGLRLERGELLTRLLGQRLARARGFDYAAFLFDTCACRCPGAAAPARGAAGSWRTVASHDGRRTCYELAMPGGPGGAEPLVLSTTIQVGRLVPSDLAQRGLFLVLALAAGGLVFCLLRFATGRLFFLPGDPPPDGLADHAGAAGAASSQPVPLAIDRAGLPDLWAPPTAWRWQLLDLRSELGRWRTAGMPPRVSLEDDVTVVVVDHFDDPGDEADAWRRSLLAAAGGRRLVLLCSHLPGREPAAGPAAAGWPAGLLDLLNLLNLRASGAEPARLLAHDPLLPADVERLEGWLLAHQAIDQRRALDLVGDAVAAVYAARWEGLAGSGGKRRERTPEEILVLRALTRRQWLTVKADRHLDRLRAAGFVAQDPRPRVVGMTQRFFLRDQIARESQQELAELDRMSTWHRIKIPLAVTLALVMAFLFLTQRELFHSTVAMVGTLGGGLAAAWELLGDLRGGKGRAHS